ncbi:MAG: class I SAM-dependent methyltransferase [Acidobacteria bacterium]|nr:class I SAM-dependent methyltransferase [Acidobacteriota bacterium]MCI0721143.1 class I SAM-dependent methyltransferase [Acidobacteriota bacterium]
MVAAVGHKLQMRIEWGWPPEPEWFDHAIDLYYQWHQTRNPLWLERGCYSLLALRDRGKALELCCGDGFNACHSSKASQLVAVDFNSQAIRHAQQVNWAPNVEFRVCDIRKEMPEGDFDNIIWDAAIEHFTPAEISTVMQRIKQRLGSCGILSGYTIVEKPEWGKQLSHHEYEFKSKDDLSRFLEPYFKNVKVFETIYASRHNLYFYASDGVLPFDSAWKSQLVSNQP